MNHLQIIFDNDPFFLNLFAKAGFILTTDEKVRFDQYVDIHRYMVKTGHQLQVIREKSALLEKRIYFMISIL